MLIMILVTVFNLVETNTKNICSVISYAIPVQVYTIAAGFLDMTYSILMFGSGITQEPNDFYKKYFILWIWIHLCVRLFIIGIGFITIYRTQYDCTGVSTFRTSSCILADWIIQIIFIPLSLYTFHSFRTKLQNDNAKSGVINENLEVVVSHINLNLPITGK